MLGRVDSRRPSCTMLCLFRSRAGGEKSVCTNKERKSKATIGMLVPSLSFSFGIGVSAIVFIQQH